MTTLNISLPEPLREYIDGKVVDAAIVRLVITSGN